MFCHLLSRSAGAMAPRGSAIFVGEMPMFGVVAVFAMRWVVLLVILWAVVVGNPGRCHRLYGHCAYSAPWVVGFGKPVGLLCGLVVGLHSQYGGKNKKKRIQDTIW